MLEVKITVTDKANLIIHIHSLADSDLILVIISGLVLLQTDFIKVKT